MQNPEDKIIDHLTAQAGIPPQIAQQIVKVLPKALQTQGIDIRTLPPKMLLGMIQQTYQKIIQQKNSGAQPMQTNPQQMAALSQAAQSNNK